jgi:hypothetical protein
MSENEKILSEMLLSDDVEFCDMASGEYSRAISVFIEGDKIIVGLERID